MALGEGGRQNPIKLIASLFFVIKIVKYFGIGGGGLKSYKLIMPPTLSVIKIVKYCGQKYNAYKQYNCIYCLSPTDACEL